MQSPSRQLSKPKNRTLSGRTFLITRTHEGNVVEKGKLQSFGAKVIELPSISITAPSSWKRTDGAISRLEQYDWIVFTSANGVKSFFDRVKKKDPELLARLQKRGSPRYACVGPATKRELEAAGFMCSLQPKEHKGASLGKELAQRMDVKGTSILLARAEVANMEMLRILRKSGAKVTDCPVYRTVTLSKSLPPNFIEKITDITLTSPSTVDGLLSSVSATKILSHKILIHCIGPVTAKRARARGLNVETVAKAHTIDGLVEDIVNSGKELLEK